MQPPQSLPKAVDHRQGPRGRWAPHIHAQLTAWPYYSMCRWPEKGWKHSDNNLFTGNDQAIRAVQTTPRDRDSMFPQTRRVRLTTATVPGMKHVPRGKGPGLNALNNKVRTNRGGHVRAQIERNEGSL